jgi:hypothetical protein
MRSPTIAPVLLIAFAACAAPPEPPPPLELAPFRALRPSHFPGASSLLTGFAAADDDPAMRVGDAVLLGVEVHTRDTATRQLVLLEVTGLPMQDAAPGQPPARQSSRVTVDASVRRSDGTTTSEPRVHDVRALHVRMTRCNAAGTRLRSSDVVLYEELLATGWWPFTGNTDDARSDDLAKALVTSLQDLASRDAVLQEVLFQIVDEPSLWSVATNLGLGIELRATAPKQASPIVPLDGIDTGNAEVRSAAFNLRVNGDAASSVQLLVTKPRGATRVCGGLLGAIAQHPTDRDRLTVVRLLATRRGASALPR